MKRIVAAVVLMLAAANATAGDPRVENVRARQIPDTKDVEVVYDLVAPDGGLFKVSAIFQAPGVAPEVKTVTGDFGSNVAPGRNRRFVWDAGADWPNSVSSNFVCIVRAEEQDVVSGGVQLWAGGPYWAECNVGASKPEEYGLYFIWGDTVGHVGGWKFFYTDFGASTCPTCGKSYFELQTFGYIDIAGNLKAAHDAATAHLGAPWRMPTDVEFWALCENCTVTYVNRNGVDGLLCTGKDNYASKSIFLPGANHGGVKGSYDSTSSSGFYWSATMKNLDYWTEDPLGYAYHFVFLPPNDLGEPISSITGAQFNLWGGFSVRPVR